MRTVPSERMKTGDFGELLTPSLWFGSAQIIRDPGTGQPFAGNVIPKARQSANGMALLSVYPQANLAVPQGTSNWFGVAGAPTNQRKDNIGIDLLPTSKDSIRFRAALYHYYNENPFQTGFLFSARTFQRPNQTASLNWTHTFSPTLILESLVTASRDQVFIRMTDTAAFDRTKYGLNYPYIFGSATKDRPNKLPAVSIPGFSDYTGSPYPSSSTGPIYVASANVTKIVNNHTVKFGFSFERAGQNDYDQINIQGVPGGTDNQNGRFEFSNSRPSGSGVAIGDTALGLFNSYAEIGVRSFTPYRGHMYEAFAQDEWKATAKLKVMLGVRWTVVQPYYSLWRNMTIFDPKYYDPAKAVQVDPRTGNPIPGTGDPYNGIIIPGDGWPDSAKGRVPIATSGEFNNKFVGEPRYYSDIDYGNFQPRLGIAYQLNPKTVIRSGAGKFSTRLGVSDSIFLGGNPPLQPLASVPTGSVDNPGGGSRASFPLSVNTQARVFHMPEAYSWNLTVEREILAKTVVGVSYVGRRGLYGQREKNINQPRVGAVQANPGVNVNALRPYKGYGPIRETFNDANSIYNALQLEVTRRYTNGLSYGLAYTLSKCEDSGSAQRDVIPDAYDASFLWGPCNYDTRHVAVVNWIYQLPFFRKSDNRFLKSVAGGWQITGVTQFQTGTPFNVQTGDDFAGIGPGSGNNIAYFWKYAGYGGSTNYPRQFAAGGNNDPAQWLTVRDSNNSLLFTQPAAGTIVRDRLRNSFYPPGFQNWNLGLFKEFAVTEQQKVLLRFEAFNWPNHPNWGGVGGNPRGADFGKVTGKSSERNLQLSLRYSF
ncbi:MAG: TonB-dependent receptor [Acidobacteria bacterium]|nr:TonB-dependent receptor [Acidobacteriota bacterium]